MSGLLRPKSSRSPATAWLLRSFPVALVLLTFGVGCSRSQRSEPAPEARPKMLNEVVAVVPHFDSFMDDVISFYFAVYYLPAPSKDPLAELDLLLKDKFAFFHRIEKITGSEEQPSVAARIENDASSTFAPPGLDVLAHSGRGLSREQAVALQSTEQALVLGFVYPKEHYLDGMRAAVELAHALAASTGGLLWDEETREVFSPLAWQERRIDGWTEPYPNIAGHTTIHAYKKDEYVRAITLGMAKFGLPDIVVEEFSWSLDSQIGNLISSVCQTLIEGSSLPAQGNFDLDFRTLKNSEVRQSQITSLKPNATGILLLSCKPGTRDEGDPDNRLIEITFDRGDAADRHAQQEQIVGQAYGWEDAVVPTKHDEELEAASQQARKDLPALRAEFDRGLAPGEFVLVKIPFDRPDGGREWMWVEVVKWNDDDIEGLLKNEPYEIPTLHAGQRVQVSEAKVFDYIRRHADGSQEGNGTAKILERRAKP